MRRAVLAGLCALGAVTAGCAHSTPTTAPSRTSTAGPRPTTTTATTVRPAPATTLPTPTCTQAAVLSTWSVARRAAQLIMAPAQENDVLAAEPLVATGVGGITLFGTSAPPSLPSALAQLRTAAFGGLAPLIATDEEGGGIQSIANLVGSLPWPRTMAATMTPAGVRAAAQQVGTRMRAIGVTMDLAPVLDLSGSPGPNAVYPDGPRSFSLDPTVASTYGLAFSEGLVAAGIVPVVKHFPGLGQATANTDFARATIPPLAALEQGALAPFKDAIGAHPPAVMVSHASVPGLTDGLPFSLSSAAVTGLLRQQLGFGGLVITDSLSAHAISDAGYSEPEAAVLAVEAGADMVIFNDSTAQTTTNQIIAGIDAAVASGKLSESRLDQAVEAVLAVKGVNLCP